MSGSRKKPLPQLESSLFDYYRWEGGGLTTIGLQNRYDDIVLNMGIVQEYAIGWAYGLSLPCRPKDDCRGVMFEKNGERFWTHLYEWEFTEVFTEE